MNINVSLYQPKRYTRWECHLDKEVHQLIGDCLYFTGWTKEEAIKSYREKGGDMPTDTYLWG